MGLLFSFAIFVIVVVAFFFGVASGCEVYCCWSEELGSGLGNASSVKEEFGGATGCVDGCGYVSVYGKNAMLVSSCIVSCENRLQSRKRKKWN